MYCSSLGLSQPSGLCHSGFYCTQGAIHPAPIRHKMESAGPPPRGNDICPPGHFCPTGTSHPLPCPPGTYSPSLGLGAEEQCQPCPAGRYCSQAGLSDLSQTSPCNAGYVCHEGNSAPCPSDGIRGYKCPSGFHCPTGTRQEIPCEPGTFSPMPGASTCLPCPAGMTCRLAATVEPVSCPKGYYCPAHTAMPLPCPEGTMNTLEGALSPTACKLCPVGRYCSGDGNWEPDGGSSPGSCVPCYPGFFCASIGLSSPTGPCAGGFYCPANFSSFSPTAFLCPKGHFCSSGSAQPTPCPTGEYQPNRGSESCIPCQPGFYCQEATAGDPQPCPPHSYCPEGALVPSPCPDGTFTLPDMIGLREERECLACSPGHYCRGGRLEGKCAAGR
nr:sushi, von Willebrand factor type A, EGF and pentraxin domain-containing protein 1-like [Pelodiscus sinensis]|eukprot:XP_025037218.1 sushi, von Willebrand factor type A, EGF and pentraxin domain-containing protein 1-like [Pelodiscus sinensis]